MPSFPLTTVTLFFLCSLASTLRASPLLSGSRNQSSPVAGNPLLQQSRPLVPSPQNGDHPDWLYQNGHEWWQIDRTQQDHARFHCYLAMSASGDYSTACPKTFTKGFTVIDNFGMGYAAMIPEMDKVVLVFKDIPFNEFTKIDWRPVSIDGLVEGGCPGCLAARSVVDAYSRIKATTKNFLIAKQAVATSKLRFSVTGAGWGGMLAVLAGLDLGASHHVQYAHNSGTPRFMNYQAVVRYDNIFQFLAGQSVVAKNDFYVQTVPLGLYYHVGQKLHIHGDKTQWLVNCFGNNENSTCLGNGSSLSDHNYYFTPAGTCGSADKGF